MNEDKFINFSELLELLNNIKYEANEKLLNAASLDEVNKIKILFLGKKSKLSSVFKQLKYFSNEKRSMLGLETNKTYKIIENLILKNIKKIKDNKYLNVLNNNFDVTLPGRSIFIGAKHPLTSISEKILDILKYLGFSLVFGPEIEHDYYNFEALNMAKDHPARDMQDTFYFDSDVVLRTHTSPVQIRSMLSSNKVPIKIVSFGKVYRRDQDISHSPMFHQIECLSIGKKINFIDLSNTLQSFLRNFFPKSSLRLRPSYFPFTQPSIEVDINCFNCNEQKKNNLFCRLCSNTGWIEIMGAGMVHPKVLDAGGVDSRKYTGFAFGIGVERVALLKHSIPDIRLFFENDLNFLRQF